MICFVCVAFLFLFYCLFVCFFFVLFCLSTNVSFGLCCFCFLLLCFGLFWLFAALKIQKQSCWIQPHQPCQRGFHWLHGAIFLAHFKNGAKWRWVGVNARIRSNSYHAPFWRKSRDRPVLLFQSPWSTARKIKIEERKAHPGARST